MTQFLEEGGDLDPQQARQFREEDMNDMVKTLWEVRIRFVGRCDVRSKQGSDHDETDRSIEDGRELVRCRHVARDFKPRRNGPRDDLFAAMSPLEVDAGVREKRRGRGQVGRAICRERHVHEDGEPDTEEAGKKLKACSAVVTGAAECLGMQSMMTDLGLSARVRVWTDSNAAQGDCVKKRTWKDQT